MINSKRAEYIVLFDTELRKTNNYGKKNIKSQLSKTFFVQDYVRESNGFPYF